MNWCRGFLSTLWSCWRALLVSVRLVYPFWNLSIQIFVVLACLLPPLPLCFGSLAKHQSFSYLRPFICGCTWDSCGQFVLSLFSDSTKGNGFKRGDLGSVFGGRWGAGIAAQGCGAHPWRGPGQPKLVREAASLQKELEPDDHSGSFQPKLFCDCKREYRICKVGHSCLVCPFAIVTLFCSILLIQLGNALPLFHLYLTGSVSCRSSAFLLYEDSCEQ